LVFETGATVVPIAINSFYGLTWKEFLLRKRKVTIEVLKPITLEELFETDEPVVDDYRRASQIVVDRIGEALKK
jgi:hypothetical protein